MSWAVMALAVKAFPEKLLWVVSVLGAIGHNTGQLLAAMLVTKTASLIWYGPALLCTAIRPALLRALEPCIFSGR